jgi:hypothetical protein
VLVSVWWLRRDAATWRRAWNPATIRQLAAIEHVAAGGFDVLTESVELVI